MAVGDKVISKAATSMRILPACLHRQTFLKKNYPAQNIPATSPSSSVDKGGLASLARAEFEEDEATTQQTGGRSSNVEGVVMKMIEGNAPDGDLLAAGGEAVEEVWFTDLERTDYLLIRTENSSYRFRVTDPALRQGMLCCVRQGFCSLPTTVSSFLREAATGRVKYLPVLKVGCNAAFGVEMPGDADMVLTSPVTELFLVKSRELTRQPSQALG